MTLPLSVYIHWPFCRKKCPYCDFNSHVSSLIDYDKWEESYLQEIENWVGFIKEFHQGKSDLISIFFGGGTPSLMPPKITEAIINSVTGHFGKDPSEIEITLEANPTSIEAQKFKDFKSAGVNRVSVGIQSLRDQNLKFLGREHSAEEALKALEIAAKTFENFSCDLIYALPNQLPAEWKQDLQTLLANFTLPHISLYNLTIEPETPFAVLYKKGKLKTLSEDHEIEMFEICQEVTKAQGLKQYEISNYSRAEKESIHNLSYWKSYDYLGIGPGAHGRVTDYRSGKPERWASENVKSPKEWLNSHTLQQGDLSPCLSTSYQFHGKGLKPLVAAPVALSFPTNLLPFKHLQNYYKLEEFDLFIEVILMGLRLDKGLDCRDIERRLNVNPLIILERNTNFKNFIDSGYIFCDNGYVSLSKQGKKLTNHIINEII